MGMTNAEKQKAYRLRQRALKDAKNAAAVGNVEAVTAAQAEGVPVYLQEDLDAVREQAASGAYIKGMRDGFAGGRLLEQLLDKFLDDAELYEEDEMRKTLKGNRQVEAVVRERVVTEGVRREDYLLWLGRI